jgi:hypothetical protein
MKSGPTLGTQDWMAVGQQVPILLWEEMRGPLPSPLYSTGEMGAEES